MHAVLLAALHEFGVTRRIGGDDDHWEDTASDKSEIRRNVAKCAPSALKAT